VRLKFAEVYTLLYHLVYWSVAPREENIFEVYENTIRKTSEPKKEEITKNGGGRKKKIRSFKMYRLGILVLRVRWQTEY
jgi:hypothetical protein